MADDNPHRSEGKPMTDSPEEFRNLMASWIGGRMRGGMRKFPLQDSDFAAADAVLAESRFHSLVQLPLWRSPALFDAGGLLQPCTVTNPVEGIRAMVRQGDEVFLPPEHARALGAALIAAARFAEEVQAEFDKNHADTNG